MNAQDMNLWPAIVIRSYNTRKLQIAFTKHQELPPLTVLWSPVLFDPNTALLAWPVLKEATAVATPPLCQAVLFCPTHNQGL